MPGSGDVADGLTGRTAIASACQEQTGDSGHECRNARHAEVRLSGSRTSARATALRRTSAGSGRSAAAATMWLVPRISEFYGIVIAMYYREHGVPHFHATYAGETVVVSIQTG